MVASSVLAAALAVQAAPDVSAYQQSVADAVWRLCPPLRSGEQLVDADFDAQGLQRQPHIEAQSRRVRPNDGPSLVLARGSAAEGVLISFWPQSGFCSISFKGPEAPEVMRRLEARMTGEPGAFRYDPQLVDEGGPWTSKAYHANLLERPSLITLHRPTEDDESQSYVVTFQNDR